MRWIAQPLRELGAQARRIREGNLDVAIVPRSRDEIGALARTMAEMVQGLRDRDFIRDVLGRYVSPELAEQCVPGPRCAPARRRGPDRVHPDVGLARLLRALRASRPREDDRVAQPIPRQHDAGDPRGTRGRSTSSSATPSSSSSAPRSSGPTTRSGPCGVPGRCSARCPPSTPRAPHRVCRRW